MDQHINFDLLNIFKLIDEFTLKEPHEIDELNYGELTYLHFLLETNDNYGTVKLKDDFFPFPLNEDILHGLIQKNFLIYFHPSNTKLEHFIKENFYSLNQLQKDYFELLRNFCNGQVIINEQKISYDDFKKLVFIKLQNYKPLEIEDIKCMELIINSHLREKAFISFNSQTRKFNFSIKPTVSIENKFDEILLEMPLLTFEYFIHRVCKNVAYNGNSNFEVKTPLHRNFTKQLNYFFEKKYKLNAPDTFKFECTRIRTPIDFFLERNLKVNYEELIRLSGLEIINLWLKHHKLEMPFQSIN